MNVALAGSKKLCLMLAIVFFIPGAGRGWAQCNQQFAIDWVLSSGQELVVDIDLGTFPVDFNQNFYLGLLTAKNALGEGDLQITRSSGGMRVYFDNGLIGTNPISWAETDHSTYIRINPQAMSYSANIVERLFRRLGAHEGLHVLTGAHNADTLGAMQSIMGGLSGTDVENNTFLTSISGCDKQTIDTFYAAPPFPNQPPCCSPVLLDLSDNGFALSAPAVIFDVDNNGTTELTGWTVARSDDAFLSLDLNGNGSIDNGSELFGNASELRSANGLTFKANNGFVALQWYDRQDQGGNGDGIIDARDAIYSRLRLWIDWNANGISDRGELWPLAFTGVVGIGTDPTAADIVDEHGNRIFLAGHFYRWVRGRVRTQNTVDVWFATAQ